MIISRDEVPQRVNPTIGTAKFMITVIWDVNGFHVLSLMPSQCRFNAQYSMEHVIAPLVQTVLSQGTIRYTPRLNVHLDNCLARFSKVTEPFFIENQRLHVPHPPYSPDLAASDFWIFGCLKTGLAGRSFTEPRRCLRICGENSWCGIDGGFRGLD
jgi:histone-lysine N-methyltransferase SETMAR